MIPKIWITRSEPGAFKSAKAWERAGFDTYIAPLVRVSPPPIMPDIIADHSVLLITSQNALRAIGELTDRRDWIVLTVGDRSAALARDMGFESVESASGNADDLVRLVNTTYTVDDDRNFIYASGSDIRLDIAKVLERQGYRVRRSVFYDNRPVDVMPEIDLSDVTHAALYSAMAARIFTRLVVGKGLSTISISKAVDQVLGERRDALRLIASRPEESAMIKALSS